MREACVYNQNTFHTALMSTIVCSEADSSRRYSSRGLTSNLACSKLVSHER